MSSPTDIRATMLLCDSAQNIGGKLFLLGGGWSLLRKTDNGRSAAPGRSAVRCWSEPSEPSSSRKTLSTSRRKALLTRIRTAREADPDPRRSRVGRAMR